MKTPKSRLIISTIAFVSVVAGIFSYVARSGGSNKGPTAYQPVFQPVSETTTQTVPTTPATPATNVASTPAKTHKYKDGTYTATGDYDSPAGIESINVSVTIKGDIVVATSATDASNDRTSSYYEQRFISGYKAYVIGQNIDTISLDYVSGSSLTPIGFNNALDKIKAQAQA